jgi:hypothetical protein
LGADANKAQVFEMDGVFWHDDLGFVVDSQHMASSFPDARRIDEHQLAVRLDSSGKLPPLGPAPVASWVLARLFCLTRERLGFETHARLYHDGSGYYLNFVVFTRDLRPAAFLNLHGNSAGVRVWGTCTPEFCPDAIMKAFIDVLLENPNDLNVCKLTTIDTDPVDLDKRRLGKPHVYGWDGLKFLGFRGKS